MIAPGPFSLLLEWITSPQVVGTATILGVGGVLFVLSFCLSEVAYRYAAITISDIFATLSICFAIITGMAVICFNVWAGGYLA